jgi:dTDP-L-rhamnose 4-epimerase
MSKTVLITGGAGFIGSHLADELLAHGYRVRALDNLDPQVHGPDPAAPDFLDPEVDLRIGDVRDPDSVVRALQGVDAVFHFAAAVGVGQSMYQVAHYTEVNDVGTAVLLEALTRRPVQRLIIASSMSLYGEGLYRRPDGRTVTDAVRSLDRLKGSAWEPVDTDGAPLEPVPTPETKPPSLASVYALSKFDQEQLGLIVGRAYGIPTVALRFFNVYGPRQALSNPYTGVLAIFAARYLNGRPPSIFEDGYQRRDFVSVYDVVRCCRLALESTTNGRVYNVGSGRDWTIREIAQRLAGILDKSDLEPEVLGRYRVGDIRHCFADIERARAELGYEPRVDLDNGLERLAGWLEGQVAIDRVAQAQEQLAARGLTV